MTLYSEKLQSADDQEPPEPLLAPTGNTGIDALAGVINRTAEPFQQAPPPEQGDVGKISNIVNGVLGVAGAPFELLDTGMALVASPLAKLMPGMPATVITAPHLGMPHAHTHPPSMMMPLPSIGTTIGAGSVSVLIGGMPAARASDIGLAPTCGSLFPLFEIKTGSSNTFIGGSRAARTLVDSTLHCVPGVPAEKFASKIKNVAEKTMNVAGQTLAVGSVAAQGLSAAATQTEADATQSKDPEGAAEKSASAAMMAAQAAADAAAFALSLLLGKDPGIPPSRGSLMLGNPTVLIGGIPLPDAFVMLGLLKGLKKLKGGKKPAHTKQNSKCENKGEPIDPVTGASVNEFIDVEDTEPIPFKWERFYDSRWNGQDGPLGFGFRHVFQRELRLLRTRVLYVDQENREYAFPRLEDGRYGGTFAGFELEQQDETRFVLKHETLGNMGFIRTNAANTSARLVGIILNSVRSTFHYDDKDRLEGITQVPVEASAYLSSRKISFLYDCFGHIIDIRREDAGRSIVSIARYEYDEAGCLIAWHDPLGATGSYAYDSEQRMTQVTDRNGYSFYYKYDGEGRCIASAGQDQLWRVQLKYELGRTLVTEADGGQWIVHYNDVGTITRVVDPYGGTNDKVIDPNGRIIEEVDSGGRVMRWLYDKKGRNTGRMDRWSNIWPTKDEAPKLPNPLAHEVPSTPLALQWGNVENLPPAESIDVPYALAGLAAQVLALPDSVLKEPQVRRDAAGRVIEEVDVYGRKECFAHDPAGNVVLFKNKDGKEYRYTTSSWNLRSVETDPLGNSVRYGYTLREKVAVIIDANGNESSYTYDYKDRITSVKRHGVIRETYKYDVGDRLIEKRDGDGNVLLRFEVGKNGLHSKRFLASGEVHTYEYDERGNFTNASTEKYDVRMTYDSAGRRTSDKRDGFGVEHRYRGNHLARTEYFGRFVVEYEVQPDGAVLIRTPVGGAHRIHCSADGRILMKLGNGTSELRRFDNDGRCVGRVRWHGNRTENAHWVRYQYSPVGELQRVTDSAQGAIAFQYDAAHRLIGEACNREQVRRFEYDPAGNLLSTLDRPRMRCIEGNRLVDSFVGIFQYNHRNHLVEENDTAGKRTSYHFNSMDLLVKVAWEGRNDAWTAEYDGLCRRIAKRLGERCAEFYWDGDRLAAELAADGCTRIYVYSNEHAFLPFMFIDYVSLDAAQASGRAYFVFCNQVGLPERIEDEQGGEVWRAQEINPYGHIEVASGSTVDYELRWPGHWFDPETGLHYNRFRSYSPKLGRYLQSDPAGQSGGINLYAYTPNPLVEVDVLGLSSHPNKESYSEISANDRRLGGGPENPKKEKSDTKSNTPTEESEMRDLGRRLEPILVEAETVFIGRHTEDGQNLCHRNLTEETQNIIEMRRKRAEANQAAKENFDKKKLEQEQEATQNGKTVTKKNLQKALGEAKNIDSSRPSHDGIDQSINHDPTTLARTHIKIAGQRLPSDYKRMRSKLEKHGPLTEQDAMFVEKLLNLERARKDGMIVAMDISSNLGIPRADQVAGWANPMHPKGGAVAAHVDDGHHDLVQNGVHRLDKPPNASSDPKSTEKRENLINSARDMRHASIGKVFSKLNELLNTPGHVFQENAVKRLGNAYREWVNDETHRQELVNRIVDFLEEVRHP